MDRDPTVKIKQRRGCSPARFPACFFDMLRTANARRRCSGGAPRQGRGRRGAGSHGELVCMANIVVRFWKWCGEAAGGGSAVMSFGLMKRGSICCRLEHSKWIRRRARIWGREGVRKEAAESPVGVGIDDEGRRHPQAPTRNFVSLAALLARE
jgi:hypothetical protein